MLSLTLALPLLFAAPQDDAGKDAGPSKEAVAAAVERLAAAFDKEKPEEVAAALQAAAPVPHADVVALLEKRGLSHPHPDVLRATFEALGNLPGEAALEALHGHAKRNRKALRKNPELYVPLLQAIARHADPSSIDVLTRDLFGVPSREVIRARVLGLGRIRSARSVEELIGLMKKAGRNRVQPYMEDFRLALVILTHVDKGTSQDAWLAWWNASKKGYELPEGTPKLPERMQTRWDRYWGEPRRYQRQKRRGERGNDPEDDGDAAP